MKKRFVWLSALLLVTISMIVLVMLYIVRDKGKDMPKQPGNILDGIYSGGVSQDEESLGALENVIDSDGGALDQTVSDGQKEWEEEVSNAKKRTVTNYPDNEFIDGYLLTGDYGEDDIIGGEWLGRMEGYMDFALKLSVPYIQSAIIMDFQGIEYWKEVSDSWQTKAKGKYDAYWLDKWDTTNLTKAKIAEAENYLCRFTITPYYADASQYSFRIRENGEFVSMITLMFDETGNLNRFGEQLILGYVNELPKEIKLPEDEKSVETGGAEIIDEPYSSGGSEEDDEQHVGDLVFSPAKNNQILSMEGGNEFALSIPTNGYKAVMREISETIYKDFPSLEKPLKLIQFEHDGEDAWKLKIEVEGGESIYDIAIVRVGKGEYKITAEKES